MANRPTSATITMNVEGAEASRRQILTVGEALRDMDQASLRGLSDRIGALTEGIGSMASTVKSAAIGLVGIGSIAAFAGWVKSAADAADSLGDLSKSTGVAIEDLSGLKLAAEQSGSELGGVASALNKLSMNIAKDGEKFRALGITAKEPLEAFQQLSDTFSAIQDPQTRAALGAFALGESWSAAAPLLAEGGERIGEMVAKGKQLSGMTAEMVEESDKFNDSMAELSTTIDGFKTKIASDMLPSLNGAIGAIQMAYTESGKLQAAWVALGAVGSFLFTDEFSSAQVKMANLKDDLADWEASLALSENTPGFGAVGRWIWGESPEMLRANIANAKREIQALQDQINPSTPFVDTFGDRFQAAVEAYRVQGVLGAKQDDAEAKKREAAAKAAAAAMKRELAEQAGLVSEISGLSRTFSSEWEALSSVYGKGKISLEQLTKAQADLLAKQPGIKAAADEELTYRKSLIEAAESYTKAYDFASDAKARAFADLQAQKDENEQIGLGAVELAELNAVRLESRALRAEENAEIAEGLDLTGALAQKYRDEAEALRELAAEQRKGAFRKAAFDDMKAIADGWQRSAERMGDAITDSLMRGFESGKGFAANMWSTIVNMAKTEALTPFIRSTVGTALGAVGVSSTASAATGASAAGSLANGLGLGGIAASVGTGAMQTAGALLSGQIGLGSTLSAGFSALGAGSLSGITAGLSSVVGALGPIALGIGAVAVLASKAFGRGPKEFSDQQTLNGMLSAGGFTGTMDAEWVKKGGWFSSDKRGVDRNAVGAELSDSLGAAYSAITKSSAEFAQVLGINADSIASRTQDIKIAMGKDEAANQKAVADFFAGVANTVAGELLPAVGSFSKAGEAASATLQRLAVGYTTIDQAFGALSMSFGAVGVSSLEAREQLLSAAGGLDAFAANMTGFQQNYLSEVERNAPVLKSVTEQLSAMGLAWIDTRDEFKQYLLSLNPSDVDQGKQLASLLNLQSKFAQLYPAIDKTAIAAEAAAKVLQERAGLQDRLDAMLLTTDQLRAKELAMYDDSNQALLRQIFALEDQKEAAEKAATAQEQAAQVIREAQESAAAAIRSIGDAFSDSITRAQDAAQALRNFNDSLKIGNLSALDPDARYREAKKQFLAADTGDTQAMQAFLQASKDRGADSFYYERDFAAVQAKLAVGISQADRTAAALPGLYQSMSGWISPSLPVITAQPTPPVLGTGSMSNSSARVDNKGVEARLDKVIEKLERVAQSTGQTASTLDFVTEGGNNMVVKQS